VDRSPRWRGLIVFQPESTSSFAGSEKLFTRTLAGCGRGVRSSDRVRLPTPPVRLAGTRPPTVSPAISFRVGYINPLTGASGSAPMGGLSEFTMGAFAVTPTSHGLSNKALGRE